MCSGSICALFTSNYIGVRGETAKHVTYGERVFVVTGIHHGAGCEIDYLNILGFQSQCFSQKDEGSLRIQFINAVLRLLHQCRSVLDCGRCGRPRRFVVATSLNRHVRGAELFESKKAIESTCLVLCWLVHSKTPLDFGKELVFILFSGKWRRPPRESVTERREPRRRSA